MIMRGQDWLKRFSSKQIFLCTFLFTLPIFYLRGKDYSVHLFGDDAEFVSHALQRVPTLGFFSSWDSWGLLDPFNGYLAVYLRLITHLILLTGSENFTAQTFWVMTFYWSVISGLIAYVMRRFTGAPVGWAAGFVLAVMPYSNRVMLAQANTVAWPACLLTLIVVGTREYPRHWFTRLSVLILFAGTAASTPTTIVTIAILGLNLLRYREKRFSFEHLLFLATGFAFFVQYLNFTPRHNPPVPLLPEILRISFGLAPQSIRAQILQPLTPWQNFVLYAIPIVLFFCIGLLIYQTFRSHREHVLVAVQFIGTGVFLAVLLTTANGWLNSQYLFIPTALLWIGTILIGNASIKSPSWWKMVPLVTVTVVLLMGISGTFFLI